MPVALGAVWLGPPWFDLLWALVAALMAWEWQKLVMGRFDSAGMVLAGVAAAATLAVGLDVRLAALVVALGPLLVHLLTGRGKAPWMGLGALYLALPAAALVWSRQIGGAEPIFWLLAVVWATDVGAYAAGRGIGGPKLAPRVSPNKTWAGLLGGMLTAAGAGAGVALGLGAERWVEAAALGGLLAVLAQGGDLFESFVKRRFGVKDSSALIPGHGGLLDRFDGLLAAAPVVAGLIWLKGPGLGIWP